MASLPGGLRTMNDATGSHLKSGRGGSQASLYPRSWARTALKAATALRAFKLSVAKEALCSSF